MFGVNSKYKVADDDSVSHGERATSYYHVVSYEWDMPIFFVTFDVLDGQNVNRLMVQAAGSLGLFAVLKFYPQPAYRIQQIEIKVVNHSHTAKPWVTKSIIEAFEGQLEQKGEIVNGIKYICGDRTFIYDPPEFSSVQSEKLTRCIHIEGGF